jgi:hypothetical protein
LPDERALENVPSDERRPVTEGVDSLAVSVPNPDAIMGAIQKAVQPKILLITLNFGAEESASLGAIAHVGQSETIRGPRRGREAQGRGRPQMICLIHELSEHRPQPAHEGVKEASTLRP